MRKVLLSVLFALMTSIVHGFPNICSVVSTSAFKSCLGLSISTSVCGFPPRPCAHFSYYVPQHFIEVVSQPGQSFFSSAPGVIPQFASIAERIPFGAEADEGNHSFHAHTINVPYTSMGFSGMPCGGAPSEMMCFSSMSEQLGDLWKTGEADKLQPKWLAWSAAPKACLLKGAATSFGGQPTLPRNASPICSSTRAWMRRFPPSTLPVCSGWGMNYPRYGTVFSSDQNTASLVISSRITSLGNEVFGSVPRFGDEKWQMILPNGSSCFREGQNVGILRTKKVNEIGRIKSGRPSNYLYAVWKKVQCTRDIPYVATTNAWPSIVKSICKGL